MLFFSQYACMYADLFAFLVICIAIVSSITSQAFVENDFPAARLDSAKKSNNA